MSTNAALSWLNRSRSQLAALMLALVLNALITPGFLSVTFEHGRFYGSIIDILNRGAPTALVALGMSLVIATRGVDLSVGAVMAIAGACAAATINTGAPWPFAIVAALGAGLICGLWNGVLVAFAGIQPIVATLILMVAGRGVAQLITDGRILTFTDTNIAAIGSGAFVAFPIPVWIALAIAAALVFLTRASALGLFIEATGINPRASWLAGVDTKFVLLGVYVVSGLTASIAGLIVTADIRGADANNAGLWVELDAILAAVVGGASLYGGRFALSLAAIGALILQTLKIGILRSGLPPEFNMLVMALLIAAILVGQSPAGARFLQRFSAQSAPP